MSDFNVRRVGEYGAPKYPNGVPEEAKAPMIGAKASALAPLAFIAIAPLYAEETQRSTEETQKNAEKTQRNAEEAQKSAEETLLRADGWRSGGQARENSGKAQSKESKPIERLTTEEVEKLVGGLVEVRERGGAMELGGKPMPIESRMSEAEVRVVLEAFLKKNGLAAESVRVVTELSEEERDVLALRRARGEARVMMVETSQLEYSRAPGAGGLPSKKAVIFELMGRLEEFVARAR
jgi:hypothetical protein